MIPYDVVVVSLLNVCLFSLVIVMINYDETYQESERKDSHTRKGRVH